MPTYRSKTSREGRLYMVNAHCADALVCISNCDKITPGMLMAALRLNIPAIFVSGGPMEAGKTLVGYKGSPLIWRLNNGAKSVGRVQSATLHLVCQREREIQAFIPQDYWSVFVDYAEGFRAFYNGTAQTASPATDEETSDDAGATEKVAESTRVLSQAEAERLVEIGKSQPHQVQTIEGKLAPKKPPAPFITSSLQQAAGARLKFSPKHTMSVAQKLYEAGLITYIPEFDGAMPHVKSSL